MLGEHGMYVHDCLTNNYIGTGFIRNHDLSSTPFNDKDEWRRYIIDLYLNVHPDRSIGTARNAIGFLWTVCFGLQTDDVIITPNGEGGYHVGMITGDYYYVPETNLPHRRAVKWMGIVISRESMSQNLKNSTGSIGTCCNITKYAVELEQLINAATPAQSSVSVSAPANVEPKTENYKERSLHRLLSNYLLEHNIFSKTIFHESSNKSDQAQKWVHPDMVGVEFNEFQDSATRALLKSAETKEYIALYSYELKRTIDNDHQLKEYFFQALSNSSWANYGYLVAFQISDDVLEEMERLNRSFGIGIIQLSPYYNDTKVLYPARRNELDYYTIDKLCKINPDFRKFITKTTKVLNASSEVLEDVKGGLLHFCDKGFSSDDDVIAYCNENHIPC